MPWLPQLLCFAALGGITAMAGESEPAGFDTVMQPFLTEHCMRCHGEKKQKGELRFDTLTRDFAAQLSAGHWADVLQRISSPKLDTIMN